ncbi:MAG: hypothetical protein JWL71_2151 [Acidobacteria bacterium]|nr:hypothetical protein [Acidobacteriota bacterium]
MNASMRAAALPALVAGVLLGSAPAYAQVDFSGTWILDRAISADLAKVTLEPPAQTQARRMPGGLSGGFGGRGFGGGNRRQGQSGGNERGDSRGAALADEERVRLREVTTFVKTLGTATIEHTDHSTFTVTDAQGHAHLFPTDGTKTPQTFAAAALDTLTKWDGPHMVTVFTIGPTHDLVFTYILVPASRQLALRIQLEESGRPRTDVPELRLVYKLQSATHSARGARH